MGLLKAIASVGLKATEKVVGGTAKIAGKAVAGTAKVAGKAVVGTAKVAGKAAGGTAKFVGKSVTSSTGKVATRVVGKTVLNKAGIIAPVGGFNSNFETFVGNTTIRAASGGLRFASRHKKEIFIAGASLKAADSISHMIYKRNKNTIDNKENLEHKNNLEYEGNSAEENTVGYEENITEGDNYKMSIYDYLSSSKKQVLFRIC